MAALVKTCKTIRVLRVVDWTDVKTKVQGVRFMYGDTAIMVFRGSRGQSGSTPKPYETTILGSKLSSTIETCCLYECAPCPDGYGRDTGDEIAIIGDILKASGNSASYVVESSVDYSVFQMNIDARVDVWTSEQSLARRGFAVSLEFEISPAMFVTDGNVHWSISESVPQKILACVPGASVCEAKVLVDRSWTEMRLS